MGKVKRISGTSARDSEDSCNVQVQKETRGLPESTIMAIRINKENGTRGLGIPSACELYSCLSVFEIQAELLSYSKEYRQLNPNLEDWGMRYVR